MNLVKYILDILFSWVIAAILLAVVILLTPIILFYITKHFLRLKFDKSYIPYDRK